MISYSLGESTAGLVQFAESQKLVSNKLCEGDLNGFEDGKRPGVLLENFKTAFTETGKG